jgi:chemotaxis protein methyltransferase CheR
LALERRAPVPAWTERPISADDFAYIRDLVHRRAAITLEAGKEYLVESRLGALAAREGFASLPFMIERLRSGPADDLHRRIVEAMTNNETSFFRDSRPFVMLGNAVLPDLAVRRATSRTLNIWCAACSTGQEPYSVAMLLREQLPSLADWRLRVIASDISREALDRARAGRYTSFEIGRGLSLPLLAKYFERRGSLWEIRASIRDLVEFQEINLTHPWPVLPRLDLIALRNVLIYLDPNARRQILRKAARLLAPGGYLMLGGSETLSGTDDEFEPISFAGATCFRLKGPVPQAV